MEKEIKKNSLHQIESSLPEISSLDNIQTKLKKTRNFPILLAPIGAAVACIALAAILVPTIMRSGVAPSIVPSSLSSGYNSNSSHSSNNNNYNEKASHFYNMNGYQPKCDTFNEVAYYSYLANNQESNTNTSKNTVLRPKYKKAEAPGTYVELRERFTDNYGREHRPIPLDLEITFSDFMFFEFDTEDNIFLDERVGNGHIKGLVIQNSYLEQDMLILNNGEKYYSCLVNRGAPYRNGNRAFFQFSAHKSIEGFDYVTDLTNKRFVTLYFSGTTEGIRELDTLSAIDVDGTEYPINTETFFYDSSSFVCTIGEIREHFGLDAFIEITNNYGGVDQLVFDASVPETANFSLDEFDETFRVTQNEVFLGDNKILDIDSTNKIYASEINKDSHRDLVFETVQDGERTFVIYDVYHNRLLYSEVVSTIKFDYDFKLDMMDNHLIVKWLEPGMTSDEYVLDYGHFAYHASEGIGISWEDIYSIGWIELLGVYEADGVTPVECVDKHYCFTTENQYIIEMQIVTDVGNTCSFVRPEHPIRYKPMFANMKNTTIGWEQVSVNKSTYRYQINFSTSGFSYYQVYFYHYYFELKAAVDYRLEQ